MTDAIRGILGTGETAGINPSAGAKTGQAPGGTSPAPANVPGDSANVSQTQSLLETISAAVAAIPTVDSAQVSEIRQAIANGTYQINPQQVAKQLLSSDQALTGPAAGNE
jgi:negative regulator of flagellin synthesis FlgM